MLLIGSQAIVYNGFNPLRQPQDIDYISTIEEYESTVKELQASPSVTVQAYPLSDSHMVLKVTDRNGSTNITEFEIAWEPGTSSWELLKYHNAIIGFNCAPIDTLLLLKLSHRYKKNSPHFLKTMQDIVALKAMGASVRADMKDILKLREKETYNYAHPSLNQSKSSFFTDSIKYVYDHDSIHRAVAIGTRPAYLEYVKDGEEVMFDKNKWKAQSYAAKLNGVIEESYVLAIERVLVPFADKNPDVGNAFLKALEKVCTSITSGVFREFAYDNYDAAVAYCNLDFADKFKRAVESGTILPYNGKQY